MKKIKVAAALMAVALAVSCVSSSRGPRRPESPPMLSPTPQMAEGANTIYSQAEDTYTNGEFEQAAQTYMRFIASSAPDHPLADNAYFKIGMCWFEMKRYDDALYFFNAVMSRFPDSENRAEALVNSAISMYHLEDLEGAEKVFNRAMNAEARPDTKAYILFYKGAIAEKRENFNLASRFYIQAGLMSQVESLLARSKTEVERVLTHFVDERELDDIRQRYTDQWPAGYALLALINIYSKSGQEAKLAQARQEYYGKYAAMVAPADDEPTEEDSYRPTQVKIGVSLPLTGPGSAAGLEMIQGIQLALNSFLKLMKEKNIQLVLKDSGLGPEEAAKGILELAQDRDTLAILGPAYSDEFKKAASVAEGLRIPIISPSASEEGATSLSRYLFRTTLTNKIEAGKMATMAVKNMGLKKFVIIYPADRQGRELSQYFTYEVLRLGGEVVTAEAYMPEQTDFGEQIRRIGGMTDEEARETILAEQENFPDLDVEGLNGYLQSVNMEKISAPMIVSHGELPLDSRNFLPGLELKYDAVYLPGMYDKVSLILPELQFYNISGIVQLSSSGVNHPSLTKIAEKYAEGLIFLDGFHPGSMSPQVRAFMRDYRLYFRSEPTILSAQAYDAAVIVLSALARGAGSRFEMARHIRSLYHFEGVTGEMSMGLDGEMDKSVVFLTVEGSRIVEMIPPPPLPETLEGEGGDEPLESTDALAPSVMDQSIVESDVGNEKINSR
ncbi:MAG: penicillin-binding protein activator [Nitrospinota bacterium]|nr:penicillin-binding protein activator [Nitrospinota bacterium]